MSHPQMFAAIGLGLTLLSGCNVTWPMLPASAVVAPLAAMEGRGIVYAPPSSTEFWSAEQVAAASVEQLVEYYAPVLVQGQGSAPADNHQWPVEADSIGRASLVRDQQGRLSTRIDTSQPTVYGFAKQVRLGAEEHVQLTYLVWYPRHPRTKAIDIEAAEIDSGILRITLDREQQPMIYESVLACGCYHKVFAESWVEAAAQQALGPPLYGKRFSLESKTSLKIDWEVAGLVDTPREAPVRPVVFVSAGEHRNIGLHTAANFNWSAVGAEIQPYRLAPYHELLSVPVEGTGELASIFDPSDDQQVLGADRMEKYIFMWIGTDDAGHPRRDDEILLHFDQSQWNDPANFHRYLRIPPGLL